MHTEKLGNLVLSQLMLGTCQFGLDYGIANRKGRLPYKTALDILSFAYKGGINCLDTASAYGTSEKVIGKALRELGISDKIVVVTKVHPIPKEGISNINVYDIVEKLVTQSLKNLRLEILPICLIHREEDFFSCIEPLLKLKDKGLIAHIGCSVMTPEITSTIISSRLVDIVQVPGNIIDRRFVKSGIYELAKESGVKVFVRSIFLQGLILMPEEDIPVELNGVIPFRRGLQKLANEAGMSLSELAVRYVLGTNGLTCVIVGVDTTEQLCQNIEIFSKEPLDLSLIRVISQIAPDLPDDILMPNKWPKRILRRYRDGKALR